MPSATSLQSIQNAKRRLSRLLKKFETVPVQELEQSARRIYAEAVAQTPYESGTLEDSVYVRVSKKAKTPGLLIGASARNHGYNYAGIQHENEEYKHRIKGKAHYLIDPLEDEIERWKARVKKGVKL